MTVTGVCPWCTKEPLYQRYHDEEWGVPVHDDQVLFEFLVLEGAQAGLSWITVLRKRARYREWFAGFDPAKVAGFGAQQVASMLQDPGIIRHRLKLESAITNARAFLAVQKEFGSFDAYLWGFAGGRPIVNYPQHMGDVPAATPLAERLSKDLRRRGFRFVGPTIVYAYMQAVGVVNDHLVSCPRHSACAAMQ